MSNHRHGVFEDFYHPFLPWFQQPHQVSQVLVSPMSPLPAPRRCWVILHISEVSVFKHLD